MGKRKKRKIFLILNWSKKVYLCLFFIKLKECVLYLRQTVMPFIFLRMFWECYKWAFERQVTMISCCCPEHFILGNAHL